MAANLIAYVMINDILIPFHLSLFPILHSFNGNLSVFGELPVGTKGEYHMQKATHTQLVRYNFPLRLISLLTWMYVCDGQEVISFFFQLSPPTFISNSKFSLSLSSKLLPKSRVDPYQKSKVFGHFFTLSDFHKIVSWIYEHKKSRTEKLFCLFREQTRK